MRHCLPRALATLLLCVSSTHAYIYRPVLNIQTGRPDLITPLSSDTVKPGSNVTVSSNTDGSITISATGGGGGGSTTLPLPGGDTSYINNTTSIQVATITVGGSIDTELYYSFQSHRWMSNGGANGTTCLGRFTCFSLAQTGVDNTVVGDTAGFDITSGVGNVIVGGLAGNGLTTGIFNTLIGKSAGGVGSGSNNTSVGHSTLSSATGFGNSILGANAGDYLTSGSSNTIVGMAPVDGLGGRSGDNRVTFVGFNAKSDSANSIQRAIAIGYNATVSSSNIASIGGSGLDGVWVQVNASTANVYEFTSSTSTATGVYHLSVSTSGDVAVLNNLSVNSLTSGQCVQTATGGLLTGTGSACSAGGGGGASTLAVTTGTLTTYSNPALSSPTAAVVALQTQFNLIAAGTTVYWSINTASATMQGQFPTILGTVSQGVWNGTRLTSSFVPLDVAYNDVDNNWSHAQTSASSWTITTGGLTAIATGDSFAYIAQFSTSSVGSPMVSVSTQPAVLPFDYELTLTSAATSTMVFGIQADGHVVSSGTTPTIVTCGASPSVDGTDTQGVITIGGGVVTSCTLNFANAFGRSPVCIVSDNSTTVSASLGTITNTSAIFNTSATLGGGKLYYICVGNQG